jgi:hypothetical protein
MRETRSLKDFKDFLALAETVEPTPALLFNLSSKDIQRLKELDEDTLRMIVEWYALHMFGPIGRYFTSIIVSVEGNNIYRFYTPAQFIRFIKEGKS